jgi:NADPH:quinone reductase-like Zn-dependent oxidoreductase
MRAVRFHEYGPVENLRVEEVARPAPQAGQVLVRVHAAGVNPVDWKIRMGWLKDFMPIPLPAIPGVDLAGTVEALGPDVGGFQIGQAVYGRGMGAYAEYAVAPAASLAPLPRTLSFEQAATVPVGAATAWSGLIDVGQVQAGQHVLVNGAAGGVGLFAVQLARWKGAHVIGTASGSNVAFVQSLGAEKVIDYIATPFETVVSGVDLVLDTVGGETQERSWQVLKPGGILVAVAGPASEETARQHGVRVGRVMGQATTELLTQVGELIDAGIVRTEVGPVFPLTEAARAQAVSESGHGRGRIVLRIAG